MKKWTKVILAVCLAVLLLLGVGGYAYVADYYHADEAAVALWPIRQTRCRSRRTGM